MSTPMYGLSAGDVASIKRLLQSHNNRTQNTANRPIVPEGDWHENQQTESYIVKTPTGGIPGLTDGGSGSIIPGYAVCPVYRIALDLVNNIGDYLLETTAATDRLVFNLSASTVAGDQYMLVDRDKFGNWVVTGSSFGGSNRVTDMCLVQGPDGWPVGISMFEEYADGRARCVVVGWCDEDCDETNVPPSPPPPPPPVTATISGNVSYEGGGPVVGRTVVLQAVSSTTTTDFAGDYSFSGVPGPAMFFVILDTSDPEIVTNSVDGGAWSVGETAVVTVSTTTHTADFKVDAGTGTAGTGTSTAAPPPP